MKWDKFGLGGVGGPKTFKNVGHNRAVGRSENSVVPVVIRWA